MGMYRGAEIQKSCSELTAKNSRDRPFSKFSGVFVGMKLEISRHQVLLSSQALGAVMVIGQGERTSNCKEKFYSTCDGKFSSRPSYHSQETRVLPQPTLLLRIVPHETAGILHQTNVGNSSPKG